MDNNQAIELIESLDNKDFGIYFFTLDTKGNPTAGIANIYEHVKVLTELGYKAYILHEDVEYHGVREWLGDEYADLPHVAIKAETQQINNKDFIIIPEAFANVMKQWASLPAKKIVLSQSYDYILELINMGETWGQYGISDVITTTEKQGDYIKNLFPGLTTHIVPVAIPTYFKASSKPKKPIVSILTRDQRDTVKLVKSFYLQYPMYKWLTFRELRGMPREKFAEVLGESCLSVWVDDTSSFGTFPIESIESDTPVVGKIPDMIPEWMDGGNEILNNGIWTDTRLAIPDLIQQYIKVWLEDSVPAHLIEAMEVSKGQYTEEKQAAKIAEVYGNIVNKRKEEITALIANAEEVK